MVESGLASAVSEAGALRAGAATMIRYLRLEIRAVRATPTGPRCQRAWWSACGPTARTWSRS